MILAKTEGNPFFMEEIVQELREQEMLTQNVGAGFEPTPITMHLPTTVQGVLSARMDRLPSEEKALLQTLAVIGREFSSSLLHKVVTEREEELHRLLSRLQASEFVYEQPAFPEVEYIFKHALTQEVAYNSLLLERRKVLHERTAQAMEDVYRHRLDDHYSELAYHYSRSGNTQKAVDYLQLAGQQAVQRSANVEAISHLTKALELLTMLSDTPERSRQELDLQITLGPVLFAIRGWASPDTERAYTRARELCEQMGKSRQLFSVLYGLCQVYTTRAEYQVAHELGEQLFSLAQHQQDPALFLVAHFALGNILYYLGEFAQAREHLEQGLALYDAKQHRFLVFLYGQDLGVTCWMFAAFALCQLGYPDQAFKTSYEALTLAQELTHPFSLAIALATTVTVHQLRREEQEAQKQADALIALCTEQGIPFFLAWGMIWRGRALAAQGQAEEGIAQIRQGLAAFRATGAGNWRSLLLALLAEAHEKVGQMEEGLIVLAEALVLVEKIGERNYEAELYRLKGTLLLQSKVPGPKAKVEEEAAACFLKAIEIARRQQAKSLELRAVMSLVRLRQHQARDHATRTTQHEARVRLDEAHIMLSEVYNWFVEGFDTKDLQEAKVLLAELTRA